MRPTVAADDARTPANSRRVSLEHVRATSHPPVKASELDRREVLRLIQQTRLDTGMSQKELALNADVTESEMSEALSGARRFSAEWLWMQPDRFLLKFVDLLMDARHLTPENVRAVRASRIKELIGLLLEEVA
jgi:hypothetical protein